MACLRSYILKTHPCCKQFVKSISTQRVNGLKKDNKNKMDTHQIFDYILVMDLEASCNDRPLERQEIIEFPVYKVNMSNLNIESKFHTYVRPTLNPHITTYCTKLTGITQGMLEDKPTFKEVLKSVDQWMKDEKLFESKYSFLTSGNWDIETMLLSQCISENIDLPQYFSPYININKSFASTIGKWPNRGNRIKAMCRMLDIENDGPMHSGTVDCQSIVKILQSLAKRGCVFQHNAIISEDTEINKWLI